MEMVRESRRHPRLPPERGKSPPVPQILTRTESQDMDSAGHEVPSHGRGEGVSVSYVSKTAYIPVHSAGVRDRIKQLQHVRVPPEYGERSISQEHSFLQRVQLGGVC